VTEIVETPNRAHALVIDSGWREVAETALAFVRRFVSPDGTTHADSHAAALERGGLGREGEPQRLERVITDLELADKGQLEEI
jgi:hypothetical protein